MDIHDLVVDKIAELTRFTSEEIRLDYGLRDDLKMDEDDFSFLFVPELEKAIGMELPQDDWTGIRTVGEIVRMIERKIDSRPPSDVASAARNRTTPTDSHR